MTLKGVLGLMASLGALRELDWFMPWVARHRSSSSYESAVSSAKEDKAVPIRMGLADHRILGYLRFARYIDVDEANSTIR